jgi:hypothetical protein
MNPTEKKGIQGLIRSVNWDDKAQLTDCISSLCKQFNEQHSIEEDIDDETRVQKLNELYYWFGDLYDIVKKECANFVNTAQFWSRMMDEGKFFMQDNITKELCRAIGLFYFIKCNNDIAKYLFDKGETKYNFFKKFVVEGLKEIYFNIDKKDILSVKTNIIILRSHVSKSMLADSFNALDFEMFQEEGFLGMFVTILETLQGSAQGETREELANGIQRLIKSLDAESGYVSIYEGFFEKFSS